MFDSAAIWTEIRRHPGWLFLGFLVGPFPVGLATIWPILTDETVPAWLTRRGWPHLTTLLFAWLALVGIVVVVIVLQAARRHKTHTISQITERSSNGSTNNPNLLSVELAEVVSEWRKLDASQKQLLARIYVSGQLAWNQIDDEYKQTRPIYAEPLLFDYLLERSTLLDCDNPTTLIGLSKRSSFFINPVWRIRPALRVAVGEVIARRHEYDSSKESQLASERIDTSARASSKSYSLRTSLVTVAMNVACLKVHRLLAFWIQLIFISSVFAVIGGEIVGGALVLTVVVTFPLCLVLSRVVNRSLFLSVIVGAVVVGILEGGFAYSIRDWGIRGGMIFGGFYGASLTSYFSSKSKYIDLFWVATCALGLVGILLIVHCSGNITDCVRMIGEDVDRAVRGAIIPIILGLGLSPVITPLSRLMESFMDRIVDLFPS
jgi:hypothetical protein